MSVPIQQRNMGEQSDTAEAHHLPSFAEATRVWFKIGCLSFGGPAGQIALLHREVVDERKLDRGAPVPPCAQFLHPAARGRRRSSLAIYLGWLMHGAKGGAVAGLLFRHFPVPW